MEGNLNVGHLVLGHLQEVAEEAAQDGLMKNIWRGCKNICLLYLVAHHHHVLLPLQLHDDGLHPRHQVLVTLAVGIPAT